MAAVNFALPRPKRYTDRRTDGWTLTYDTTRKGTLAGHGIVRNASRPVVSSLRNLYRVPTAHSGLEDACNQHSSVLEELGRGEKLAVPFGVIAEVRRERREESMRNVRLSRRLDEGVQVLSVISSELSFDVSRRY